MPTASGGDGWLNTGRVKPHLLVTVPGLTGEGTDALVVSAKALHSPSLPQPDATIVGSRCAELSVATGHRVVFLAEITAVLKAENLSWSSLRVDWEKVVDAMARGEGAGDLDAVRIHSLDPYSAALLSLPPGGTVVLDNGEADPHRLAEDREHLRARIDHDLALATSGEGLMP